ncbi:mycothiol maleylpyruvate isomerase-like protein [Motilibacter peucedani]|uniref:Mycothiol maleylpyruvate isomerase-like protein n=1 Tax=Motilibacter peucedani TaxID=598650 RepID=A0A420XUC1_9ACTN|nr:maleylpyruvate isomerase N-terminal domain-containing protein [Motilibacter peucedani]RKS80425.1 mycothiol maleylpyruvate isomerase-like protein [Motilibacter peucedani]
MIFPWDESRAAYADAAHWFVVTAALVGDRWAEPGLGEWDLRSLVGHTTRSFVTVESYLAVPPERVEVETAAGYVTAIRAAAAAPGVAERGREAGAALGDDPVAAVAVLAERVVELVGRCTGEELLTTLAGGMRLRDYLPTRTFELVTHTCDLSVALGVEAAPPATAAEQALGVVAAVAAQVGGAAALLLSATGRRPLPEGFSVL